jgi:hypothetical protein
MATLSPDSITELPQELIDAIIDRIYIRKHNGRQRFVFDHTT